MPFKPNYRLQRADRQRAKEEKQQKKLLRRAARDADPKTDSQDVVEGDAPEAGPGATKTELPS